MIRIPGGRSLFRDFSKLESDRDSFISNEARKLSSIQRHVYQGIELLSRKYIPRQISQSDYPRLMIEVDNICNEALNRGKQLFKGVPVIFAPPITVLAQVDCRSGCSHCCKWGGVHAGKMEIDFALKESEKITPSDLKYVVYKALTEQTECCFLSEKGKCLIYEARPIACRTFYSITPSYFCNEKARDSIIGDLQKSLESTTFVARAFWDVYYKNETIFDFGAVVSRLLINKYCNVGSAP